MLLFGLMDWSWFMFHQMTLSIASHRGVRLAAGVPPEQDPALVAQSAAQAWLDRFALSDANPTVEVTFPSPGVIAVAAEIPFDPLIGLLPTPPAVRSEVAGVYYGDVY